VSKVKTYTTAPQAYDGFGTTTMMANVGRTKAQEVIRLVETPPEHVPWQRSRYRSGMYVAVGESEWYDLVAHHLVILSDEPEACDGP
jgi:hypothetical protein